MPPFKYIDSGYNVGFYNMSVDEELLARAQAGEKTPVLRFYGWRPPAVSIGRFQKIEDAVDTDACKQLGFDVVRRITGGRAVLHHTELTYSIIARTDNPLFPNTVLGTYKVIAAGLLAGLKYLGINAEMVSRADHTSHLVKKDTKAPACFSSPSWYEIVADHKKIIGSAQRRLSGAFLQHGSILIRYDSTLEAKVIPGGSAEGCVTCIQQELNRAVSIDEVKRAFLTGFSQSLEITFIT